MGPTPHELQDDDDRGPAPFGLATRMQQPTQAGQNDIEEEVTAQVKASGQFEEQKMR